MPTTILEHWPSGARDTTEFPKVSVNIDASMRDHLKAFTRMDGVIWTDYDKMITITREVSGTEKSQQRLRTYRKMYEKFGLIYQSEDKIRLSRLGKQMESLESDLEKNKELVLDRLRKTAIDILSRYQLRNPVDADPLPDTCDVLPAIVIWKAMRELDNKLHPEEINRVLMYVMRMDELDAAIEKIKSDREKYLKYYGEDYDLGEILGEPVHTEQVQARIAPWFSFIGWGGLIIEQNVDSNGFRNLTEAAIPTIDEILKNPPTYYEAKDETDWLNYYIGDDPTVVIEDENDNPVDKKDESVNKLPTLSPRGDQPWLLNQILFGAPGTGKTYSTAEYASAIVEKRTVSTAKLGAAGRKALMTKYQEYVEKGLVKFTTFHQSYGYEDFIQGICPDLASASIAFRKVDGVFKKAADTALVHPENNYVIIIDEINRANISRVFGELITLIEDDKRWGEINQLSVTLPMGELFVVPNNLYIIGTMNSADKSISLIDTALRRRFSFIEMPPIEDYVEDPVLKQVMSKLNEYLKKELRSTDLLIGHAYFIGKKESDLLNIMNNSIIPLLYEYFYDDANKVEKALECLDETNYEIDPKPLGRVRVQEKKAADD